jgi:NAD(P)-dependent dehydrogenase (short-subunit alcohol dehydrogenase family)
MDAFALTLQRELAHTPVRTLLVVLGEVRTQMVERGRDDPVLAAIADRIGAMGSMEPKPPLRPRHARNPLTRRRFERFRAVRAWAAPAAGDRDFSVCGPVVTYGPHPVAAVHVHPRDHPSRNPSHH